MLLLPRRQPGIVQAVVGKGFRGKWAENARRRQRGEADVVVAAKVLAKCLQGILRLILIFREAVLLSKRRLRRLVLMREIGFEARAEIDVPAPETAEDRFGILVVMSPELAGLAGIGRHRESI